MKNGVLNSCFVVGVLSIGVSSVAQANVDAPRRVCDGGFGTCTGAWSAGYGFGAGGKCKKYTGTQRQQCRTIMRNSHTGNQSPAVRACSYTGQCDSTPPKVTAVVNWTDRPVTVTPVCVDAQSGCNPSTFVTVEFDKDAQPQTVKACDFAGNCTTATPPVDRTPPTCTASYRDPLAWHKAVEFPANGGDLKCWINSCNDVAGTGEQASGCLPIPQKENTPAVYNDPQGENPTVQVITNPLQPVHGDICEVQVCDNAGHCSRCDTSDAPLKYDNSAVCKRADGVCKTCDDGDNDCLCIAGDPSKCRADGPINCYTNPFHSRCPGTSNPVCLLDPLTPGCPLMNPCYPTKIYAQAKCPEDSRRFCWRNPNHYTCNTGCASGDVTCGDVPKVPVTGGATGVVNCTSAADCSGGTICSVDAGVCNSNSNCTGAICTDECWGTCIDQNSATNKVVCEANNGNWLSEFSECEGLTEEICTNVQGTFNSCASSCRNNPDQSIICTQECVQVCKW